jgi:phosphoserine aminotransferase
MTSNFQSRPIDVGKFGVIFAGAQKNCSIPGLTIVIVRNLVGRQMRYTSNIQSYQVMQKDKSLHNTPLTFSVPNLRIKWALERDGLEAMD